MKLPIEEVPLDSFWPSPENDQLYRPVNPDDPEIRSLAKSIREKGVLEPIVVTLDDFILSGHRRYAAAKLAGLKTVSVRRYPIRRTDDVDAFVVLLREYNRQREKTTPNGSARKSSASTPTTPMRGYGSIAARLPRFLWRR